MRIKKFEVRSFKSIVGAMVCAPMLFAVVVGCSPSSSEIQSPKCVGGNANCDLPSMTVGVGSDSETSGSGASSQHTVNNDSEFDPITIKTLRFGETSVIEFIFENPKLIPLKFSSLTLDPGSTDFTEVAGVTEKDCHDNRIYYQQKCGVGIKFAAHKTNQPEQKATFVFTTLLGENFTFKTGFKVSGLLADFTVDEADLGFQTILIYSVAGNSGFERDMVVTNYATKEDIEKMSVEIVNQGSSPGGFTLVTTATDGYCQGGQTLAANSGTCKIKVRYRPLKSGASLASLKFAGAGGIVRNYSLKGEAKSLEVSGNQTLNPSVNKMDFGAAKVNASAISQSLTFTAYNSATDSAAASSCSYGLTGSAQVTQTSLSCTNSLAAGASCAMGLRFTPDSVPGDHKSTVTATCDSRGGGLTIPIGAKTVTVPLVTDQSQVDFGEVLLGGSATKTITFTNLQTSGALTGFERTLSNIQGGATSGTTTGTESAASSITTPPFTLSAETCTTSIDAAATCTYSVSFAPTQAGSYSGEVSAKVSDGGVNVAMDYNVGLSGIGKQIVSDYALVDFGAVQTKRDQPGQVVTLTNPSSTMTASDCTLSTTNLLVQGFSIDSESTCLKATSIAPGATCNIKPRFNASGVTGLHEATTTFTCAVGGQVSLKLAANLQDDLRLVVTNSNQTQFMDRLVGVSDSYEYVLTDMDKTLPSGAITVVTSTLPASVSRVNATGGTDCSAASLLTTGLNSGESCRVKLNFAPLATSGSEATGSASGTLGVSAAGGEGTTGIDPTDPVVSTEAKKILASSASLTFGEVLINTAKISATSVNYQNPSMVDGASSCSLTVSSPFSVYNSGCEATLNAGTGCNTQVKLPAQSSTGNLSGNLDYTCAVGGRARVSVTARVMNPPNLTWTGSGDFGYVDIGGSLEKTLTLTNAGDEFVMTAKSLTVTPAGSAMFTVTSNNCPTTLSAGQSCQAVGKFTPTSTVAQSYTLTAAGTNENITTNITVPKVLTGQGVDPNARISPAPSSLTFGTHLVNSTSTQSLTLTNAAPAGSATNITYSPLAAPISVTSNTCASATLAPNANCVLTLQYAPTVVGSTSGSLTITASPNASQTIPYSGTAVKLTTNVATAAFGTVDLNTVKTYSPTITVTNPSANESANNCSLSIEAPYEEVGSTTCGATLAASSTCTYQIRLPAQNSPANYPTKHADYQCTRGDLARVDITGAVYDLPVLTWSGSLTWGYVDLAASAVTHSLTLTNTEGYAVTLTSVDFTAPSTDFSITTPKTCANGLVLAGGATCTTTIAFDPSTLGSKSAVLRADPAASAPSYADATLTGTGSDMSLSFSVASLTFATVEVGQSGVRETLEVTLTNNGSRTANLGASTLVTPSFSLAAATTCAATLASGASCKYKFDHRAATGPAGATYSETFTVTETPSTVTQSVTLTGTTNAVPIISIKDNFDGVDYAATPLVNSYITGNNNKHARNIVGPDLAGLTPSSAAVTLSFKNAVAISSPVVSMSFTITKTSGVNGTMVNTTEACTTATLASGSECNYVVTYTPGGTSQSSVYKIAGSGVSALSGASIPFEVTNLRGHAITPVSITISSPTITLGGETADARILPSGSTQDSPVITVSNTGEQIATSFSLTMVGGDLTKFSLVSGGLGSDCTSEMAGSTGYCTLKVRFTPGTSAGYFVSTLTPSAVPAAAPGLATYGTASTKAVSYRENTGIGAVGQGAEPRIASDENRIYVVTRDTDFSTYADPILKVCTRATNGEVAVDGGGTPVCTVNILNSAAATNLLAGTTNGSGPKIAVQGKKILIAVQNKDVGQGGEATTGNSTLIVCQKPTSNNTVTFATDCVLSQIHSAPVSVSAGGLHAGISTTATKVAVSNQISSGFILVVCDLNSTTDAIAGTLDTTTCRRSADPSLATEQANHASLYFDGTKAIVAGYANAGSKGLYATTCQFLGGDNTPTCGTYTLLDNTTGPNNGVIAGAMPFVIDDGTRFFVVHQFGSLSKSDGLRLATCDYSGQSITTPCTLTTVSTHATDGYGFTPSGFITNTSSGKRLWIAHTRADSLGDSGVNQYKTGNTLRLTSCSISGAPSCPATPTDPADEYFRQTASASSVGYYNRDFYYDSTKNILLLPFVSSGTDYKTGILSIGLWPELKY